MSSNEELRTQTRYMVIVYQIFLNTLLIILYCGKYLCSGLAGFFACLKGVFDGGVMSVSDELKTVNEG